jgi:O-antigen/teichoic acid export membrane protein
LTLFSRSFWKDLVLTYSAETIVMGCGFLAPGLVARSASLEDLGVYLLLRRVASSLLAPLSLGMAVALARSLPVRSANPSIQVRWSILGIGTATSFTGLVTLGFLGLRTTSARLLLGSAQLGVFALPLALLVLGNVVHAVLYGHYRGMMQMRLANALQALNLGIVPVAPLLRLRSMGLVAALNVTGLLMLVVSALFLLPLLGALWQTRGQLAANWSTEAVRSLLGYGLGRVPGFVFAGLLLTLGPIWVAHKATMTDVAMYALGLSFVRMMGAFFGPIGVLVLPRLAGALGRTQEHTIKRDLQLLLRTAMLVALFACLQAAILSNSMLLIWVGSVPPSSRLFFVPLVLVLPMYLAYEVLRNPIDAISAMPYNTVSLGVAVLILVLGAFGKSPVGLVCAQLASFVLLGGISITVLGRLYRFRVFELRSWLWPGLISFGTIPLTWTVQNHFRGKLVVLGPYEVVLFACFVIVLLWTVPRPASATQAAIYPAPDATASLS